MTAFHGRGLDTPLDQIAAAAGVSKATIYNRFGGLGGLIDAVIEELVAEDLRAAMNEGRTTDDPWRRLTRWIMARRDLQYREPAFTDVMIGSYAESRVVADLATQVARVTRDAVQAAHAAQALRSDVTAADLHWADVANGLALRELRKPPRRDYERRTMQYIDSLRPR